MIHTREDVVCYHCGLPCGDEAVSKDEKAFCCQGCRLVFELIEDNNLCQYYDITSHPGVSARNVVDAEYEYLNEPKIRKSLLEFESDVFSRIRFSIPAIHCSSCIWLLENLHKVDEGVLRSEVNFNHRQVCVDFDPGKTNLARLASTLSALGYPPAITTAGQPSQKSGDFKMLLKLAIAGFAFGNVMLFSFPEYLGLDGENELLGRVFSWLNLVLSIPVIIFSASDYFRAAVKSFRQKQINVDVPIALGLLALFLRSSYDIITNTGPGYLDSLTGLVFFLLIGRWVQGRTYESLSFERDFKSYFPLAVQKVVGDGFAPTVIFDLRRGDRIRIRNLEIVPADSILLDKVAFIDYGFVTGESKPVKAQVGDLIYAGGRLIGQPVTMVVDKETTRSHLTSLWNREAFRKKSESSYRRIIDRSARVFSWIVLFIAAATAVFWFFYSREQMWLVLTSVLMVACPCALALAAPFTFSSMMRQFGRYGFYLKNADVVERLSVIDTVVFDKTGTVTHGEKPNMIFIGDLDEDEFASVKLLTGFSAHPLSALINKSIKNTTAVPVSDFHERLGRGIEGIVAGRNYKIGSAAYVNVHENQTNATKVFVSIENDVRGFFLIKTSIRENIGQMLNRLGKKCFAMLSGDSTTDEITMTGLFPAGTHLRFNQQPADKRDFVADLQSQGRRVAMIGDGLNDAGAFRQADVGIAVTDDTGLFTPGSDGILQGSKLQCFDKFLLLARKSSTILKTAFAISFAYNAVSLAFAVTGNLTPLTAAVLMPLSSLSVVGFSTIAVKIVSTRILKDPS